MKKKRTRRGITILTLLIVFAMCSSIPALGAVDYTVQSNRLAQNTKMMNKKVEVSAYKSKCFTERVDGLWQTHTKITSAQQKKIAALGVKIIQDKYKVKSISKISDVKKLAAFHDWMRDNYYYRSYSKSIATQANPYKQYLQYKNKGKVAIWCNGYAAMFTVLARSQNIPTRMVRGHYVRPFRINTDAQANALWDKEQAQRPATQLTHWWTQSFVKENGKWRSVMVDCNADGYNSYKNGAYKKDDRDITVGEYGRVLFDPSMKVFSRTHIWWTAAPGNPSVKGTLYKIAYK